MVSLLAQIVKLTCACASVNESIRRAKIEEALSGRYSGNMAHVLRAIEPGWQASK